MLLHCSTEQTIHLAWLLKLCSHYIFNPPKLCSPYNTCPLNYIHIAWLLKLCSHYITNPPNYVHTPSPTPQTMFTWHDCWNYVHTTSPTPQTIFTGMTAQAMFILHHQPPITIFTWHNCWNYVHTTSITPQAMFWHKQFTWHDCWNYVHNISLTPQPHAHFPPF